MDSAQATQEAAVTAEETTPLDNNTPSIQNGVEKHENGNPPASGKENGESCENVRTKATKQKTCRGDSTDALLSDEEKSVEENPSLKD